MTDGRSGTGGGATRTADRIARRLRGMIHRGEVLPGERFPPERELAVRLGISRLTLREALKQLQEAGYLEVRRGPQGGAFVRPLDQAAQAWRLEMKASSGEFDAAMDLRVALECHAAFLAAQRRGEEDLDEMQQAIDDLAGPIGRADYRRADTRFHAGLAAAARSPRVEADIRSARGQLFQPYDLLSFDEPVETTRQDHAAILAAVRIGSPGAAAEAMRTHVERTRDQLREILQAARS